MDNIYDQYNAQILEGDDLYSMIPIFAYLRGTIQSSEPPNWTQDELFELPLE